MESHRVLQGGHTCIRVSGLQDTRHSRGINIPAAKFKREVDQRHSDATTVFSSASIALNEGPFTVSQCPAKIKKYVEKNGLMCKFKKLIKFV